jgi:hypothetical protein
VEPKRSYHFHKGLPVVPILGQMKSGLRHTIPSNSFMGNEVDYNEGQNTDLLAKL